jgi:NAD(P)-dependent dehydrogenase (short-subunit alcohol dehydrogenase family)
MSQNVIVTGTNSGLGKSTALTLTRRGHKVFGTMRDVEGRNRVAAEELEAAGVQVLQVDLRDDASVNAALARALAQAGHLDALVNNAGYGLAGHAESSSSEQLLEQLDVNVVGPHRMLRAALPSMRERRQGLLIHISSSFSRIVVPFVGPYCASKAAFESLLEAYAYELMPIGIETTLLQPGAFRTNFMNHVQLGSETERAAGYGPLADGAERMAAEMGKASALGQDPQLVADAVVGLIEGKPGTRPRRLIVDEQQLRALVEGLNHAHDAAQSALLTGLGMGALVGSQG